MRHKPKSSSGTSPNKSQGKSSANMSKGKGKGRISGASETSSPATASGSSSGTLIELRDSPLALHDFSNPDHQSWVPRFHAVLCRNESVGVGMEDLDVLQLELEAMLAAAAVRRSTFKEELVIASNLEKYKGSGKNISKRGPGSPGKRGASSGISARESAKKYKTSSGKPFPGSNSASSSDPVAKTINLPKVRPDQAVPSFDPLQNEQIRPLPDQAKAALPKNETPNRFWTFVEPYCAPITPDDVKLLEDLIKTHGDISEYFRVPPLGQHYSQRWAKEDLENEMKKGSNGVSDASEFATSKLLKKGESAAMASDDATPFGELTQRLVAGLMEENVMTAVEDSIESANSGKIKTEDSADGDGKANFIKSLNISNAEALEARVRKELEEQGILDPNDADGTSGVHADDEENDEILEELRRCQMELKAVSNHNLQQLHRLLKAAKEEMVRQELRQKLQEADTEVMDAYAKISAARSKKKVPSKKEREQAWKALKAREIILKELESA